MNDIPQCVITCTSGENGASQALIENLQELAKLQDTRYHTLFESLRRRVNMAAEEAGIAAREALQERMMQFAQDYRLDVGCCIRHFASDTYPADPGNMAIFNGQFDRIEGWKSALSEAIGNLDERARILPTNLSTQQALEFIHHTQQEAGHNHCRRIIVEISDAHPTEPHRQMVDDTEVIQVSPQRAMHLICEKLGIDANIKRDLARSGVTASL